MIDIYKHMTYFPAKCLRSEIECPRVFWGGWCCRFSEQRLHSSSVEKKLTKAALWDEFCLGICIPVGPALNNDQLCLDRLESRGAVNQSRDPPPPPFPCFTSLAFIVEVNGKTPPLDETERRRGVRLGMNGRHGPTAAQVWSQMYMVFTNSFGKGAREPSVSTLTSLKVF